MAMRVFSGAKACLKFRYLFQESLKWAPASHCQSPHGFEALDNMLRRLNYLKLLQPAIENLELDDEVLIVCCRLRIALELESIWWMSLATAMKSP
jgi:hypothetical protein